MSKEKFSISVKCLANCEELLAEELQEFGVEKIKVGKRVVYGECTQEIMYRICYCSRLALRVYVPIAEFFIRKVEDLYKKAMQIEWDNLMLLDQTFAIDAHVRHHAIQHPHFASLKVKDAIADYFRKEYDQRPNVNADNPDVLFHLHIDEEKVTVSLDAGGRSLNQRGYRMGAGDAPLNEVLAAALIRTTGWKGETVFIDPMCGSGTLVIEAAMVATHTPAQWAKPTFQFMRWPGYQDSLWQEVKEASDAQITAPLFALYANDLNKNALGWAKKNAGKVNVAEHILFGSNDFFDLQLENEKGILAMNPPYGERLDLDDAVGFYKNIGNAFKSNWKGWKTWVFSGNLEAMKRLGLKPSKKSKWVNAKIDCVWYGYEIFDGSMREFKTGVVQSDH
jgi:putative N6-adenine-specific DNA methylase